MIKKHVNAFTAERGFIPSTGGFLVGSLYMPRAVSDGVLSVLQEIQRLRSLIAIQKASTRKPEFDRVINVNRSNFDFLEVAAGEAISFELAREAPVYRPSLAKTFAGATSITKPEWRVLHWLRARRRLIWRAEREHGVDRRAIAAVIAWEALLNVQRGSVQSVGPGKMHLYSSKAAYLFVGARTEAIPQQLERRRYQKPRSDADREQYLSTTPGAIEYIASAMDAAADVVEKFTNAQIRNHNALLAHF